MPGRSYCAGMRLKNYLHQISPLLSSPDAARRLLRIFALVLLVGILGGVYSFLLFTFNNEVSQRRSYMSSAIAEAHTFFTTREALLESLSLSATRKAEVSLPVSDEEIRLLLGQTPGRQWSIWLTQRMRDYLQARKLNLLYVSSGAEAQVWRLYNTTPMAGDFPRAMLDRLETFKRDNTSALKEIWLTHNLQGHSQLYIFIRLDERDINSGWLGLEMDGREVSSALSDHSAGEFTMFNSQGMPLFSNSHKPPPEQHLPLLRQQDFFGFVGDGWLPEQLVLRKQLKSSDWQLTYSIDLRAVLWALWPQMLGALLFCLLTISLVCLLTRRLEHRFITPAIHRIQALVESELFSRDVIQTAPVALCVLRRTDGAEVLKNTLAQQWLGERGAHLGPGWIRQAFDPDAPSLTVKEPSRRTSPSRSRRPCRLTTPATRLAPPSLSSSGWLSRCLSSRRRLPSAGASHCGHRLSCLSSIRLVVPSPRFSRRHLPSASASASHRAVASSCHAHLGPLVRLVKASPLFTPLPPICGIIESSQRSGLMLV